MKLKEAAERENDEDFDKLLIQFSKDWREFMTDRPRLKLYMTVYINNFLIPGEVYSLGKYQAMVGDKQIGTTKYLFIRGETGLGFTPIKKFRIPGGEVPFD